eukprot:1197796-Karenia_brevis.AAC.1
MPMYGSKSAMMAGQQLPNSTRGNWTNMITQRPTEGLLPKSTCGVEKSTPRIRSFTPLTGRVNIYSSFASTGKSKYRGKPCYADKSSIQTQAI